MKSRTISVPGVLMTTQAYDGAVTYAPKVAYKEVFSPSVDNKFGDRKRPNAHHFTRTRVTGLKGTRWNTSPSVFATNVQEGVFRSADLYPDYAEDPWIDQHMYNMALGDLAQAIRGSVDLSVDGAQAGKTRDMVKAIARFNVYVADFLQDFGGMPLKAIGKKWLEYQYGWKPTLSTIYEAGKAYYDPDTRLGVFKVRSRYPTVRRRDIVANFFSGCDEVAIRTEKHACEMKVWLRPPASALQDVGGYTSLNPASIAWELMPFSFLIDWFVNVGGYIRNLESAMLYGSLFESGYVTYVTKIRSVHSACGKGKNGSQDCVMDAHGEWEFIRRTRQVLTEYPLPYPPRLKPELGAGRLLNAAALLSLLLKDKR